jgi:hypothetical protein
MPVAVRDLVLEIAQAVPVPSRLRRMLMLEWFFESMPVVGGDGAVGALRPVGHDDVGVTVRLFTMRPVRVLDHFDEPVDMRVRTEFVAVNILVIVPVRHRPMLQVDGRSGQPASGQQQPHHPRRRPHQQRPRLGDRLIERAGLDDGRLQPIEQ